MKKMQILSFLFFYLGQFSLITAFQPYESKQLTRDSNGEHIGWQTSLIDIIRSLEKQIGKQKNEIESLDDKLEESGDTITKQNQRINDLENCNCQSIGDGDLLGCNAEMSKKIKTLENKAFNQKKVIQQLKDEKLEQTDKINELEDSIKKQKPEHDELTEAIDEQKTSFKEQAKKLDDIISRIDKLQKSGGVCSKTGDELEKLMTVGTRVVRAEHWVNIQDDSKIGTVYRAIDHNKWVGVEWDNGVRYDYYHMGSHGVYDLKLAQCVDNK